MEICESQPPSSNAINGVCLKFLWSQGKKITKTQATQKYQREFGKKDHVSGSRSRIGKETLFSQIQNVGMQKYKASKKTMKEAKIP